MAELKTWTALELLGTDIAQDADTTIATLTPDYTGLARVAVALAESLVFRVVVTRPADSETHTATFNNGAALNADAIHNFALEVIAGWSYAFQVTGGAVSSGQLVVHQELGI